MQRGRTHIIKRDCIKRKLRFQRVLCWKKKTILSHEIFIGKTTSIKCLHNESIKYNMKKQKKFTKKDVFVNGICNLRQFLVSQAYIETLAKNSIKEIKTSFPPIKLLFIEFYTEINLFSECDSLLWKLCILNVKSILNSDYVCPNSNNFSYEGSRKLSVTK